jgi:hypothetical protein
MLAEIFGRIRLSARIEGAHFQSGLTEGLDGHAAPCSRADDNNVVSFHNLKAKVFRIAGVGAPGRGGIELQAGVVERFKTDAGGVEAHDGVLAEEAKELLSGFLRFPLMGFVGEPFEDGILLRGSQLEKRGRWCGDMIEPLQTMVKLRLQGWVAEHHEIDKFSDPGLAGPGLRVAGGIMGGRQYELCELFHRLILASGEKLETISGLQDALLRERVAPARETRESAGYRSQRQGLQ